jgi:hypothetical protein
MAKKLIFPKDRNGNDLWVGAIVLCAHPETKNKEEFEVWEVCSEKVVKIFNGSTKHSPILRTWEVQSSECELINK